MDSRHRESLALFLEDLAGRVRSGRIFPHYLSIDLRHEDVPMGFVLEPMDTRGRRLTFDYFVPPNQDAPMPVPPGMVVLPPAPPPPALKG